MAVTGAMLERQTPGSAGRSSMYLPENSAAICWASAEEPPFPMKIAWPPFLKASIRMSAAFLICAGSILEIVSALLFSSAEISSFIGIPP